MRKEGEREYSWNIRAEDSLLSTFVPSATLLNYCLPTEPSVTCWASGQRGGGPPTPWECESQLPAVLAQGQCSPTWLQTPEGDSERTWNNRAGAKSPVSYFTYQDKQQLSAGRKSGWNKICSWQTLCNVLILQNVALSVPSFEPHCAGLNSK